MDIIKANKKTVILEITNNELGVLSNALNEVCNGINILEFEKTIGVDIHDAQNLLDSLSSIFNRNP